MTYAFSQVPLCELVQQVFQGEWKQFRETLFDFSAHRAERACLELAILLRYLDDELAISKIFEPRFNFGRVQQADGSEEPLKLREVANKIIHTSAIEWDLSRPRQPFLVCVPRANQRWRRAMIDVVSVAAVCGSLAA